MIESSYLNRTAVDRPDLLSALTSAVDLVEQPLGLRPAPSGLPPTPLAPPLRADVAAGLRWQRAGPWTVWRLVNMTLSPGQAAALQLVMLVLPGTPSLTAGQEVGKVRACTRGAAMDPAGTRSYYLFIFNLKWLQSPGGDYGVALTLTRKVIIVYFLRPYQNDTTC